MANLYPEHLIDEIKQANDIVDVLSDFLKLKKRGANYLTLCPFHSEKTPSFSVSSTKQIYHCFGCGKGGNVYTFLMEYENMTFIEAVKYLAKRAGIKLPEKKISSEEKSRYEGLYFANQVAANFFRKQLWETEDGKKVLKYLKDVRGLSDDTIDTFGLGFAPDAWDKLINHFAKLNLGPEMLAKAGLAVERESGSGYYDRFRRRLMFPITTMTGKTIAFGGRALSREDSAKYINSPETEIYNKSKILYGLQHSRTEIRKSETALLVEGYMDFLSLWQAGFHNVIASSGTAFTFDQARLIARHAQTVVMLFDSDQAGVNAARRCAPDLMAVDVDFKAIYLPKGEDPDSFTRNLGADAMAEKIENALSFPRFIYETIEPSWEELGARQKEQILNEMVAISSNSESKIRREIFLKEVSQVFDIDLESLKADLDTARRNAKQPSREPQRKTTSSPMKETQLLILAILMENPMLLDKASRELPPDHFTDEDIHTVFMAMLQMYDEGLAIEASRLMDQFKEPHLHTLITRASNMELDTTDTERMFSEQALRLKRHNYRDQIKELLQQYDKAVNSGDSETAEKLHEKLKQTQDELSEMEKQL